MKVTLFTTDRITEVIRLSFLNSMMRPLPLGKSIYLQKCDRLLVQTKQTERKVPVDVDSKVNPAMYITVYTHSLFLTSSSKMLASSIKFLNCICTIFLDFENEVCPKYWQGFRLLQSENPVGDR
jgi:hypothetical protein